MSIKIIPYPPSNSESRDLFVSAVEQKVSELLPLDVKNDLKNRITTILYESMPIFGASPVSGSLGVSFLCQGEYTNGVGRYVDDTLSRWLVPGKNLVVIGGARLTFSFDLVPDKPFFFGSAILEIAVEQDREIAERNLQLLIDEMRLNIQAVYRARYISALKSISLEKKHLMIQENLSKILQLSARESDESLFDHLHGFFVKLNREEKMGQIQKTIEQLTQARPKAFDREMFSEMTYFTILFKDQFASKRQTSHISRIIALHYLFKKILLDAIKKAPLERHISFKVYKTKVNAEQPVLGILLGMNILRESEGLDRRFLLSSIRACIPGCEAVKDSYLFDRREKKVYLFYVEVHKPDFAPFRTEEVSALRLKLPQEVKKQIESDVHPIFLPRNEEEIARNLIILSQQLKYSRDLPQVSIQYEKQSESQLFFSIQIARLLLPGLRGLREQMRVKQSDIKFSIDEIREIGKLRRKIPKETAILHVSLDKLPFFRPDYSVDLLRARQKVAYELERVIGEYRDFNGGMILKQEEALLALRKQIGAMTQETEFHLEDYFYSLRPGIMQTVLPPVILETHFSLLERCKSSPELLTMASTEKFYLFFGKSKSPHFKAHVEIAIEPLKLPSYELTSSFLQFPPLYFLGYILRSEREEKGTQFKEAIENAMKEINGSTNCDGSFCVVEHPR